jgi:NADH-quinone oxidoreductase subunit N
MGAVLLMLVIACARNRRVTLVFTLAAIGAAISALYSAASYRPQHVTSLLIFDGYGLFYTGLILSSAFVVALLSYDYLNMHKENVEEFYLLLLLATLGSAVIVSAQHFLSFFLGLEILSISLYTLIAYQHTDFRHIEGGFKYFILSAFATSFLLFGMALLYARLGTLDLAEAMQGIRASGTGDEVLRIGLVMMTIGIGFKLAVVPFHMWAPDVFQGASAPVAAFLATCSKGSLFVFMVRYFADIDPIGRNPLVTIFIILSIASMFGGNLLALFQNNIKRLLAYSSIAHFGYLFVAFLSSGPLRVTAVAYYLVAYFIATLGAFGVITVLSRSESDADTIEDLTGLSSNHPWLAGTLSAMLFSLAGIPLSAGFIGKFYLMSVGVGSNLWLLVIILVVNSVIGLFYYLRVISALYSRQPQGAASQDRSPSVIGNAVLAALMVLLFWFGVYPASVISIIRTINSGA